MRVKLLAILSAIAVASVLIVSSPASADKPATPSESGVVERFDGIGGHGVGPVTADVGGEDRTLLAIFGWDNSGVYCNGGPPVVNGVEQVVISPSGNETIVVHNEDIPVLLFDVTDIANEGEFFDRCSSGDLGPLATGTAKQRPTINVNERAVGFKVKSQGVVTDANGQQWKLQAFIKQRFLADEPEPQVDNQWIKVTAL